MEHLKTDHEATVIYKIVETEKWYGDFVRSVLIMARKNAIPSLSHDSLSPTNCMSVFPSQVHCDNTADLLIKKYINWGDGVYRKGEILHKCWCTAWYLTNQRRHKKIGQTPEET